MQPLDTKPKIKLNLKDMDSTFVCNMNSLDTAERERYKEITAKLNDETSIGQRTNGWIRFQVRTKLIEGEK
jgi:hypothetical protein